MCVCLLQLNYDIALSTLKNIYQYVKKNVLNNKFEIKTIGSINSNEFNLRCVNFIKHTTSMFTRERFKRGHPCSLFLIDLISSWIYRWLSRRRSVNRTWPPTIATMKSAKMQAGLQFCAGSSTKTALARKCTFHQSSKAALFLVKVASYSFPPSRSPLSL